VFDQGLQASPEELRGRGRLPGGVSGSTQNDAGDLAAALPCGEPPRIDEPADEPDNAGMEAIE